MLLLQMILSDDIRQIIDAILITSRAVQLIKGSGGKLIDYAYVIK